MTLERKKKTMIEEKTIKRLDVKMIRIEARETAEMTISEREAENAREEEVQARAAIEEGNANGSQ